MFETRNAAAETQQEFWIETRRLPQATASTFYRKLDATLDSIGFAAGVREICLPAYAEAIRGGRPGIDPVVYFKMLIIGFFENLPSERSIASRCADSLSLRAFLGYGIEQSTPDHSSLSVIRGRLGADIYQAAFELVLSGLRQHGLLKGRNLGIDSSVIEANASLRELVHRNTEEQYWEYVKRLAAEAGIDPTDTKAVRRFDKKREGRKTSNEEWVNPHDPDAKVGMTKHGACDMIYKPEHITDLESGAIVAAEVRLGDQGDTEDLARRVLAAGEVLARVCDDPEQKKVLTSLTADEGYFSVEEVCGLQGERVRVIIGDPHASKRRPDKQPALVRQVLSKAKRAVKSKSGKALLRRRGEHIERSFCHVLDHGKHRRATLRGRKNLCKRQLTAALSYNLSLLMRHLIGCGTAKQWQAGQGPAFWGGRGCLWAQWIALLALRGRIGSRIGGFCIIQPSWRGARLLVAGRGDFRAFSTGC